MTIEQLAFADCNNSNGNLQSFFKVTVAQGVWT